MPDPRHELEAGALARLAPLSTGAPAAILALRPEALREDSAAPLRALVESSAPRPLGMLALAPPERGRDPLHPVLLVPAELPSEWPDAPERAPAPAARLGRVALPASAPEAHLEAIADRLLEDAQYALADDPDKICPPQQVCRVLQRVSPGSEGSVVLVALGGAVLGVALEQPGTDPAAHAALLAHHVARLVAADVPAQPTPALASLLALSEDDAGALWVRAAALAALADLEAHRRIARGFEGEAAAAALPQVARELGRAARDLVWLAPTGGGEVVDVAVRVSLASSRVVLVASLSERGARVQDALSDHAGTLGLPRWQGSQRPLATLGVRGQLGPAARAALEPGAATPALDALVAQAPLALAALATQPFAALALLESRTVPWAGVVGVRLVVLAPQGADPGVALAAAVVVSDSAAASAVASRVENLANRSGGALSWTRGAPVDGRPVVVLGLGWPAERAAFGGEVERGTEGVSGEGEVRALLSRVGLDAAWLPDTLVLRGIRRGDALVVTLAAPEVAAPGAVSLARVATTYPEPVSAQARDCVSALAERVTTVTDVLQAHAEPLEPEVLALGADEALSELMRCAEAGPAPLPGLGRRLAGSLAALAAIERGRRSGGGTGPEVEAACRAGVAVGCGR